MRAIFVRCVQTCILIVSPLAKGLFHRAIVQSGSCISRDWGPTNPTQGDSFLPAMLDAVGASSLDDLRNATKFPTELFVWPKVNGRVGLPTFGDATMPVDPREAFVRNDLNINALLIGATTFDGLVCIYQGLAIPKSSCLCVCVCMSVCNGKRRNCAFCDPSGNLVPAIVSAKHGTRVCCPSL